MLKKIRKILVDICKKNITIRKLARFIKITSESRIYRKYYQKYQVNDKTILIEYILDYPFSLFPHLLQNLQSNIQLWINIYNSLHFQFLLHASFSAFNLEALGKKDIIIEEGYPRNDSLFNRKEEEIR